MGPPSVSSIISDIVSAGKKYESNEPGAREDLVSLGQALSMALEIPSEFVQRSMWAEVSETLSSDEQPLTPHIHP